MDRDKAKYRYIVFQPEEAPETGTQHLQGYVYYNNAVSFSRVKKLLPRAHIEKAKGSPEENITYCTKQDSRVPDTEPIEIGDRPEPGVDKSVDALCSKVRAGEHDEKKLFDEFGATYLRLYKGVRHIIEIGRAPQVPTDPDEPRAPTTSLVWYYGPAGSGKDRRVRKECFDKQQTLYAKPSGTGQWWDGYIGEEAVLLSDLRPSDIKFHQFLQLTDPYRDPNYRVQVKGGTVKLTATTIYVTCPRHPAGMCYTLTMLVFWSKLAKADDNVWAQLKRRLTAIIKCQYYTVGDPSDGATNVTDDPPPKPDARERSPERPTDQRRIIIN